MSLWIKCDICGDEIMHPSMKSKIDFESNELEDWLMMDVIDLCRNCAVKIDFINEVNGKLVWDGNYDEDDVLEHISKMEI